MKPQVNLIFTEKEHYGEIITLVEIQVNNESLGEYRYGGEPEDNLRYRDYDWVEKVITQLAQKLGADVTTKEKPIYE